MADAENSVELSWPDARLVEQCLVGNENAWTVLIDRYKKLIYSVPVRWGFSQTDASDIFQSVVAELLSNLANLREPQALSAWLLQVASHKCRRLKHQQEREQCGENGDVAAEIAIEAAPAPDLLFHDAMREQMLRDALIRVPPRCRELIHMLFFENSPRMRKLQPA